MTAPTNAAQVTEALGKLSLDLWRCVEQLEVADLDAVRKRAAADLRYDQSLLGAEGPIEIRKCRARLDAFELKAEADIADAVVRNLVRRMKSLEKRVEVGRSTSSWHKAELSLVAAGVDH